LFWNLGHRVQATQLIKGKQAGGWGGTQSWESNKSKAKSPPNARKRWSESTASRTKKKKEKSNHSRKKGGRYELHKKPGVFPRSWGFLRKDQHSGGRTRRSGARKKKKTRTGWGSNPLLILPSSHIFGGRGKVG